MQTVNNRFIKLCYVQTRTLILLMIKEQLELLYEVLFYLIIVLNVGNQRTSRLVFSSVFVTLNWREKVGQISACLQLLVQV